METVTLKDNILISGLLVELTKSQADNFIIIQNHWLKFNEELKKYSLKQAGGNWEKYGVTYKIGGRYFYLAAIPAFCDNLPKHFVTKEILKGGYVIFEHVGKMGEIKDTVYNIYKNILPSSGLNIKIDVTDGFVHFEKYNYRFKWNKPDSIIEIYLPFKTIS